MVDARDAGVHTPQSSGGADLRVGTSACREQDVGLDFSQAEPSRNSEKGVLAGLRQGARLALCSATARSLPSMPARRKI
jgi:hypothetical protein